MNKGWKIIGIIASLFLLSVLLGVAVINAPYIMPKQLERFRFFVITNYYMQQYLFWAAVVFAILVFILLLVVLFYPKSKGTFVLKQKDGTLTLDKKAIEGLVRSQLHEEEFVGSPKVKIRSTKNKNQRSCERRFKTYIFISWKNKCIDARNRAKSQKRTWHRAKYWCSCDI